MEMKATQQWSGKVFKEIKWKLQMDERDLFDRNSSK